MEILIGLYSARAAAFMGSSGWLTPDDKVVNVTCVGTEQQSREYKQEWPDATVVGEVIEVVRFNNRADEPQISGYATRN